MPEIWSLSPRKAAPVLGHQHHHHWAARAFQLGQKFVEIRQQLGRAWLVVSTLLREVRPWHAVAIVQADGVVNRATG